jgi:glycosyltransferase involved in cell wall biosynthesis
MRSGFARVLDLKLNESKHSTRFCVCFMVEVLVTDVKGTKKTKIAILGSRGIPAAYGGFETIAQELSQGLAKKKYEVYVSCESHGLKLKPYKNYNGVMLVYFPIIDNLRSLSEAFVYDLLSVLWATLRTDVIYMLGYSSVPTLIFPKLFGKIVLVNVDGLEAARPKFNSLLRLFYRSFEKIVTRVADHIVVDSQTIGVYYRSNYGIEPVYIPNGGGCTQSIAPLDAEVLKDYGLEKGEYYLFIARLTPDNSIDFIVDTFKSTRSKKKLVVVGPLTKDSFVRQLLENGDKRIIFLGGIYEPRLQRTLRYYCFAYIHGHQMGGTSVSLVEAMSCRNAILAIDTQSNREVAENSATYFRKNAHDLKEKIETLEETLPDTQVNNTAYSLYQKKFSTDNTVDEFINVLETVSGRRS